MSEGGPFDTWCAAVSFYKIFPFAPQLRRINVVSVCLEHRKRGGLSFLEGALGIPFLQQIPLQHCGLRRSEQMFF
jgi:hypothetical protein